MRSARWRSSAAARHDVGVLQHLPPKSWLPPLLLLLLLLIQHHSSRGVAGQGLDSGGSLGGQVCDLARLQHYEKLIELSGAYSGGRGSRGGTRSRPSKQGRHLLLQGPVPAEFDDIEDNGTASGAAAAVPSAKIAGLCSSDALDLEGAFHIAAAPDAYVDGQRLPWVRDQGKCASCVGHAVAACAEASLAAFTGLPALTFNYSGDSLYYCGAGGRACGTAWTISIAAEAVAKDGSILDQCRHIPDPILQTSQVNQVCDAAAARCEQGGNSSSSTNMETTFPHPICVEEMAIDSVWRMQLIIRQLGGVVTRINIQNPKLFNDFFASNPTGVFNDSSTCPSAEYARCGQPFAHAILVVGYNNTADPPYWIAQNSYGTSFGVEGRFKVAFGILGVGSAADTYALNCQPVERQQQELHQLLLTPLEGRPGCYAHSVNATRHPHLSALAAALDVNIVDLVQDNLWTVVPVVETSWSVSEGVPSVDASADDGNSTTSGHAVPLYTCSSQPDCLGNSILPAAGCLLAVSNVSAAGDSCVQTFRTPNISQPLEDGAALVVCGVPSSTFAGKDPRMSGTAATVCRAGQQHDYAGGCSECVPGTFKESEGVGQCSVCSPNTFQDSAGAATCTACPTGLRTSGSRAVDHDEASDCGCPPGQTLMGAVLTSSSSSSNAGNASSAGRCVTCEADTWKSWTGNGPCLACPYGSVARGSGAGAHDSQDDCYSAFQQLSMGEPTECCGILAGEQSLYCFGASQNTAVAIPEAYRSARWRSISVSFMAAYFGILEGSGRLVAFGSNVYRQLELPRQYANRAWQSIVDSGDGLLRCGIQAVNQKLLCWTGADMLDNRSANTLPQAQALPLPAAIAKLQFLSVAISGRLVAGILANQSLVLLQVDQSTTPDKLVRSDMLPTTLLRLKWAKLSSVGSQKRFAALTTRGVIYMLPDSQPSIPLLNNSPGVLPWLDVAAVTVRPGPKMSLSDPLRILVCGVARQNRSAGNGSKQTPVYCWLIAGNVTSPAVQVPAELIGSSTISSIAVSRALGCVIAQGNGATRCWTHSSVLGALTSDMFQLNGQPGESDKLPPAVQHSKWHHVTLGPSGGCAIRTESRRLSCWGWMMIGSAFKNEPVFPELADEMVADVDVRGGEFVRCVILAQSGQVACYGYMPSWAKPDKNPMDYNSFRFVHRITTNTSRVYSRVFVRNYRQGTHIDYTTVCAIQQHPSLGKLDCWDLFIQQELVAGNIAKEHPLPAVLLTSPVATVSLSNEYACAVLLSNQSLTNQTKPSRVVPQQRSTMVAGKLYCWRYSDQSGQQSTGVGPGGGCCTVLPAFAISLPDIAANQQVPFADVSSVAWVSCGLAMIGGNNTSSFVCWMVKPGNTGNGQIAPADLTFMPAANATLQGWVSVQSGRFMGGDSGHVCVTSAVGSVSCWTVNQSAAQFGETDVKQVLGRFGAVRQVAVSTSTTCLLLAGSGDIKCIGFSVFGATQGP